MTYEKLRLYKASTNKKDYYLVCHPGCIVKYAMQIKIPGIGTTVTMKQIKRDVVIEDINLEHRLEKEKRKK
jgi:hypothetical protein